MPFSARCRRRSPGRLAAVYADSRRSRLGSAIDLAHRQGAHRAVVLLRAEHAGDGPSGRRSFACGSPSSTPRGISPRSSPPRRRIAPPPAGLAPAAARMRSAGLEVEWEAGELTGMARSGGGPGVPRPPSGFDVGVGRHDREANRDAASGRGARRTFLDQAVATVRELRRAGAPAPSRQPAGPGAVAASGRRRGTPRWSGAGSLHHGPPPGPVATSASRVGRPGVGPTTTDRPSSLSSASASTSMWSRRPPTPACRHPAGRTSRRRVASARW